ncbi:MAG: N-acetylmuramoyl-L-alanine amidase [Clostridia bacterium]|nr:N-acetylmuramoyl-L-alanine amidase [Clostridia bacterium]
MKKALYVTFSFKVFFTAVTLSLLCISAGILFGMRNQVVMSSSVVTKAPLIIIDAGHGGEDGGTQSSSGIIEKDINLQISKKVNEIFRSLGYETIMTREEDTLIYDSVCKTQREKKVSDIHNRMEIIEKYPDSIFLSIHQNHYSESKYNGAQVFYSPNNEISRLIAESIQNNIISLVQSENTRKIKESGTEIYLLYHAENPAVMVECGFLSNPGEALLLKDDDYQKEISLAIVAGVTEYLKGE